MPAVSIHVCDRQQPWLRRSQRAAHGSDRWWLSERRSAGPDARLAPGSSACRPGNAVPVRRARAGANACSPPAQGNSPRGRVLESVFRGDLEAIAIAQMSATRSQFMRSNCNAYAAYSCKSRASLPKYHRRVGASKRPEGRAALDLARKNLLTNHSFKFADYSFFDTWGTSCAVQRPPQHLHQAR